MPIFLPINMLVFISDKEAKGVKPATRILQKRKPDITAGMTLQELDFDIIYTSFYSLRSWLKH